jgi:hypothetical protein
MVISAGIILVVFGIVMIFKGIKGQESITIKSSLIETSINTSYVGLAAILIGAVLTLVPILKTYRFSTKQKIIESEGIKIREEEIEMTHPVDEKGKEE